jgi:hypothetical protein
MRLIRDGVESCEVVETLGQLDRILRCEASRAAVAAMEEVLAALTDEEVVSLLGPAGAEPPPAEFRPSLRETAKHICREAASRLRKHGQCVRAEEEERNTE